MKKHFYFLILAVGIFITGYKIFPIDEIAEPEMQEEKVTKVTTQKTRKTASVKKESPPQQNSISKNEIKSLKDSLPKRSQVEEEIKSNPHTPSTSLMTFAKRLGPLMEKAYKDEKAANTLATELRDCALNESLAPAARALCVQDTESLGNYHSKLQNKASELRASVSPEVQKILETNDLLLKKK